MVKTKKVESAQQQSVTGQVTTKYRLIFLPAADYNELKSGMDQKKLSSYQVLNDNNIENFRIGDSQIVYIPETHQKFLRQKANSGEML